MAVSGRYTVGMRRGDRQGFTLVELMIVIGLIGIIASIAMPTYSRLVTRVRVTEAKEMFSKLFHGASVYYSRDISLGGATAAHLTGCVVTACIGPYTSGGTGPLRMPDGNAHTWEPGPTANGCRELLLEVDAPLHMSYVALGQSNGTAASGMCSLTADNTTAYLLVGFQNFDHDATLGTLTETIRVRNHALVREGGHYTAGDEFE